MVTVYYTWKDLRVYPNPIRQGETLTIYSDTRVKSIEIYTLTGAAINSSQLVFLNDLGDKTTFRCDLPAGHYTIIIKGKSFQLIVYN